MPASVRKRNGRYRVVEPSTNRLTRNRSGTPVDGGGHKTKWGAAAQARAVNARTKRR